MFERDDLWADSRYFSEARMRKFYETKAPVAGSGARSETELAEITEGAIRSSLEPADRVEAA